MKAKKQPKQAGAVANVNDNTISFKQLPKHSHFMLANDSNGLCLGILIKMQVEGPHKFIGNAITPLGGAMHIGADIKVERVHG